MASTGTTDDALALVKQGWEHLQLERPLAAWASWQRALRLSPGHEAATQNLALLAAAEDLPAAARAVYRFRMPATPQLRARWDAVLQERAEHDLDEASQAFRTLTEADPADAAAWYNHALCLAWKGANLPALAALERAVQLDALTDLAAAADTWLIGEVLRLGAGAEALADDLSYSVSIAWSSTDPDPQTLGVFLPTNPPLRPEHDRPRFKDVNAWEWLDRPMPEATDDLMLANLPRVLATVIQTPRSLRLFGPQPMALGEAQARLSAALPDPDRPLRREARPLPLPLADAALWTFRYPPGLQAESRGRLAREAIEYFYENVWIHVPRHGLDDLSPLEAALRATGQDGVLVAKLGAVIRFREQLAARAKAAEMYGGYPFDRLRRRLGVETHAAGTVDAQDTSCMTSKELGALAPEPMSDHALAEAFESALGLRDDALAARFAHALAERGAGALARARVDLERLFATLVRQCMDRGTIDDALDCQARALEIDQQLTGGSSARSFATWRAEVLTRADRAEEAIDEFQKLLARFPADAKLALDAAETFYDRGYPAHAQPLALAARRLAQDAGDRATLARATKLLEVLEHPGNGASPP